MAVKISECLSSAKHPGIQASFRPGFEALVPESEDTVVKEGCLERTWKSLRVAL